MIWTQEQDEALCMQILVIEPFRFRPRTNQSGNAWTKVAEELNQITSLQMRVDQRAVRDRFKILKKKFNDKIRDEENASGIAPPELTPVEKALEDIVEREQEMEILNSQEDDEKSKKIEKDKKTAEEMRQESLETFSETRKRRAAENSEEDDENPKPRKTRRSGSDTLLYLKEKAEMEMELKKEELQLKKKEQEERFAEQQAMRQQQSDTMKAFIDMQQSMQQQVQKQAELQQQQMQQNSQMMMMMVQMMQNIEKK